MGELSFPLTEQRLRDLGWEDIDFEGFWEASAERKASIIYHEVLDPSMSVPGEHYRVSAEKVIEEIASRAEPQPEGGQFVAFERDGVDNERINEGIVELLEESAAEYFEAETDRRD